MHPHLRLVASRQLGVFTAADARTAGYRDDQIRSHLAQRLWIRLRRGVYAEQTTVDRFRAGPRGRHLIDAVAVLVSLDAGGPVLSHGSAARLHRFEVPPGSDREVRLTDVGQWRSGRGYRVARAALPEGDVLRFLRFRATTPARTLVDCAREWSLPDSVVAMDAAIRAEVLTRAQLQAAVLAARHWVGIGNAARALSLADGRAESPLETRGRLALLAAGLPAPELQVEIRGRRGFVARVDAWYDAAAVAIEFDGQVKFTQPRNGRSPAQVAWDEKRREDAVRALDIRVIRIAMADLGRPWGEVTQRLGAYLAAGPQGSRTFSVVRTAEPGSTPAAA